MIEHVDRLGLNAEPEALLDWNLFGDSRIRRHNARSIKKHIGAQCPRNLVGRKVLRICTAVRADQRWVNNVDESTIRAIADRIKHALKLVYGDAVEGNTGVREIVEGVVNRAAGCSSGDQLKDVSGGPAMDARHVPASDNCIQHRIRNIEPTAFANGKSISPVTLESVTDVKRCWAVVQPGIAQSPDL